MKKQFYHHLLSLEQLQALIDQIDASEDEKKHLHELAQENIHITIVDIVMSELSTEDKKEFLKHIHADDHEKIWELLNEKSPEIDKKITHAAEKMIEELKKDIEELQNEKK